MKLLIVDDAEVVRSRLANALSEIKGIAVVRQSQDVPEAIAEASNLRPDVAILDIRMAGGSGLDVLAHIRRTLPATLTIMFTDLPARPYRRRCADLGADYFFAKSTDFPKLLALLKQLLQHSRGEAPLKAL